MGRRAANSTGEPEKHRVVERVGKLNKGRETASDNPLGEGGETS